MNPILFHILRPHSNPEVTRRLAVSTTDWASVIDDAASHRLSSLLAWTLNHACPDAVPAPVLSELQSRLRDNAEHVLAVSAELLHILECLRDAGVQAVPFKGPAVAWCLYESPALRSMSDLDILVRPTDVGPALRALEQTFYIPVYGCAGTQLFPWRELPLTRNDGRFAIDLHWSLLPSHFHLDPEPFFERLAPVTIACRPIPTFCPADLLLFLCVHGSKHAWSSLHWLADVIRLLDRHPEAAQLAAARARAARLERPFQLGLDLARQSVPVLPIDGYVYQLDLLENWTAKLQYILSHLTPTPAEWQTLRLPSPLYPAYYLLRPIRLAAKYTGRLFS